jgi:hypothetical protein
VGVDDIVVGNIQILNGLIAVLQPLGQRGGLGPMIWQLVRCFTVGPIVHHRPKTAHGNFGEVGFGKLGSHEDAGLKLDKLCHEMFARVRHRLDASRMGYDPKRTFRSDSKRNRQVFRK